MTAAPATPLANLRAGVIGLGVGEQHVLAYSQSPGCSVAAICDSDPAKLNEVGERHGVARRYTDWRQVVDDPAIDVVSICSHDDGHAEQAIAAFRNGKHVMIEKPIALNRADAERVLRAQQDSGKLITSNLILRRSPRFRALQSAIAAGEYGEIFAIEGDYLHDILWKIVQGWRGRMDFYCVTYGGGIHLIDLMRWLIGREVEEVCAMGSKILTRDTAYRYDDAIMTLLRFEGGAIGKSFTTFGPRRTKFHSLNVYGTQGTFVNDMPHAKLFTGDQPEDETQWPEPYPAIEKGDLLPDFLDAIRNGRQPLVNAVDVFRVMDVCFASWEAVQQRRTVKVSYLI